MLSNQALSNQPQQPAPATFRHRPLRAPAVLGDLGSVPSDKHFVMLHAAYCGSGGILRGEDLAASMDEQRRGNFSQLARLIVAGRVFSFHWHDSFWIPMFQFDPRTLAPRPHPQRVLAELRTVFDGWTLATWFVQPNDWLQGQQPLELIDSRIERVLEAARADRFIANG